MEKYIKRKILVKDKWIRFLFIVMFLIVKNFVSFLISLISLFQFIVDLFFNNPNEKLHEFTKHLNMYFLQVINFLTFNSDTKPFPFSNWPSKNC